MQFKRLSGKRSLVLIAAVVFLGCLGLLVSGCVDDPHAYLWDGRTVEELPNTLGGATSEANDVNAWDWAVGWAADETGTQRAVIWKCGRMFALPSLWDGESVALAINDLGQAVGWERDPSGSTRAVMWSLGRTRDLAKSSWTSSRAYDINNLGQVVGSFEREGTSRPFTWRCGRVAELLSLLRSAKPTRSTCRARSPVPSMGRGVCTSRGSIVGAAQRFCPRRMTVANSMAARRGSTTRVRRQVGSAA